MKSMPSNKSSRASKRSRKRLLPLLIGIAILSLGAFSLPIIARSSPAIIQAEIDKVRRLPIEKQATELTKLQRATGGDQTASRALADYYRGRGDYQVAADSYLAARPRLEVEAAQIQIETYDYKRTQMIVELAQKRSNDPELKLLQAQIQLNTDRVDEGCGELKAIVGAVRAYSRAVRLETVCKLKQQGSLTVSELYGFVELGAPMLTRQGIEAHPNKTSSDFLVLAQINQRQGNQAKVLELVKHAYEMNPFDREVLTNIKSMIRNDSSREAHQLLDQVKATEHQLPRF